MIKRLVLDVEIGLDEEQQVPYIIVLSKELVNLDGVAGVYSKLYEMDRKVENVMVTVVGSNINFGSIKRKIEDCHGRIHSVDGAYSGEIIEWVYGYGERERYH